MKTILRSMFALLMLTLPSTAMRADGEAGQNPNVIAIERTDGEMERLMLDPALRILFSDGAIIMMHPQIQVEYTTDEVSNFFFENVPDATLYQGTHEASIDEVSAPSRQVNITPDAITIGGTADMVVYDLRGIEQGHAKSDGTCATLRTSTLQPGVYIVRCGNITLKVSI